MNERNTPDELPSKGFSADAGEASDAGEVGDGQLDRWLTEAAAAERAETTVDADRFMARLRMRVAPMVPSPFAERPGIVRVFAVAAMIPLCLALWLCFGLPNDGGTVPPGGETSEELALIDDLDLLELLDDLPTGEIAEIDPDMIDLYLHLDVIEELPVELLGNS